MTENSNLKKASVLYVEDEELVRMSVSRFLKRRCREVYVASNGEEGLDLYRKHKPELIITDIEMPLMSGLKMIEEILKIDPDKSVIITTGYNDHFHNDKRAFSRLIKPINNHELLKNMESAINNIE